MNLYTYIYIYKCSIRKTKDREQESKRAREQESKRAREKERKREREKERTREREKDKVIARKLQLEEEAKDNQVIGIDTRIKDGMSIDYKEPIQTHIQKQVLKVL